MIVSNGTPVGTLPPPGGPGVKGSSEAATRSWRISGRRPLAPVTGGLVGQVRSLASLGYREFRRALAASAL